MKVVFNSSLPRSGSTLLQNVLAQNPRFYCSATSGVLELLYAARKNFTELNEFKVQDAAAMRTGWAGFCKGAINGWYNSLTNKPVAIDKSRGWIYYWEWLREFYPEAKVICCVRDVRSIISSMEKLHRKNMALHDPADNPSQMHMVTIESRVKHWLSTPPIGLSIQRLSDAILKRNDRQFHFVVYERLMESPHEVLGELYDYIGEQRFEHKLDAIEQLIPENDQWHGFYGDHQVKTKWQPLPPDWNDVLGSGVAGAIRQSCPWFYDRFYKS